MCGRFGLSRADGVEERFDAHQRVDFGLELLQARFNIAPTQDVITVAHSKRMGARAMKGMRWGLTSQWALNDRSKPRPINIQGETLLDRPTYRRLLAQKRCVIPADGFYEWRKVGSAKQPYSIELTDGGLFGFAGVWDAVKAGDDWLVSCAILTCQPNNLVAQLHNRQPVILRPEDEALWLDSTITDAGDVFPLLQPLPEDLMAMYPVVPLVNNVTNEGAGLRQRADPLQSQEQAALPL